MNDYLEKLTLDLVRMRTTSDRPMELARVIVFVQEYFAGTHFFIKSFESGGKPSVVISTNDTLSPDVILLGHLDVVPAPDHLFEPRREGRIVYGRGVCDMKAECAVMMEIMKELENQEHQLNVALMLTTDEEIGGIHGANYLVNTIGYRCKVALVPDGSSAPHKVLLGNKGVLKIRLKSRGKSAHGSRPWLGENAIDLLLHAYGQIRTLFEEVRNEEHWIPSCNIGVIHGGETANQVPEEAFCDLDIRFTENETAEELLTNIREVVEDKRIEIEAPFFGDPVEVNQADPHVQLYEEVVQEEMGTDTEFSKSCGSNDGRFLTAHGIPIIVSRPRSEGQHSLDEWLDFDSLYQFKRIYQSWLKRFQETF